MTKIISAAELAQHTKPGDAWLAIDGDVYNVSKFAKLHPGGAKVLEMLAGNDVTTEFYELHRKEVLSKYQRLVVGRLEGAEAVTKEAVVSTVPFSELAAMQGRQSPFLNESHKRFMLAVRHIVDTELVNIASEMDLTGEFPSQELKHLLGMKGIMVIRMGPGVWLDEAVRLGIEIPGGIKPGEFDYFHEMIAHQEVNRLGLPGFIDGIGAGWMISAPAIWNFGSESIKKTVGCELLKGEKNSCLAISEPFAGSDVAAIRTTAEKSADGQHYIVNGVKKWITEGMFSDYFVTAVRTGKPGAGGISMLLIERGEGVETKLIKTTYSTCAGTSLVIFDNVKVPVANLLGKENDGFKLIMYNFNHERWMITNQVLGLARAAVSDAFMWAKQRKVFGKALIEQPVIRYKLAEAVANLESVQSFMEAITYDMIHTKGGAVGTKLAGPIAMLKYQSTRASWSIADNCVQILGGRGITRTGMGKRVEGFKNYVKYASVYGGSEEIMADLAIKQALKTFPTGPTSKM